MRLPPEALGRDLQRSLGHAYLVAGGEPLLVEEATDAIRAAARAIGNERLDDCDLWVTLEPCPMCAGAMLQSRVKELFFGVKNIKAGAAGTVLNLTQGYRLNHKIKVASGFLEEDCRRLLQGFFSELRRKKKKKFVCW